jgi:putative transposase
LVGDEVVITKSGKKTFGVDRFFSSIQNQVVPSISFLNISIVNVALGKAFSILNIQIVKENKNCNWQYNQKLKLICKV